jgi:hypothetical protein
MLSEVIVMSWIKCRKCNHKFFGAKNKDALSDSEGHRVILAFSAQHTLSIL